MANTACLIVFVTQYLNSFLTLLYIHGRENRCTSTNSSKQVEPRYLYTDCVNVLAFVLYSYDEVFLVLSLIHFVPNKIYMDISAVCI